MKSCRMVQRSKPGHFSYAVLGQCMPMIHLRENTNGFSWKLHWPFFIPCYNLNLKPPCTFLILLCTFVPSSVFAFCVACQAHHNIWHSWNFLWTKRLQVSFFPVNFSYNWKINYIVRNNVNESENVLGHRRYRETWEQQRLWQGLVMDIIYFI